MIAFLLVPLGIAAGVGIAAAAGAFSAARPQAARKPVSVEEGVRTAPAETQEAVAPVNVVERVFGPSELDLIEVEIVNVRFRDIALAIAEALLENGIDAAVDQVVNPDGSTSFTVLVSTIADEFQAQRIAADTIQDLEARTF